MPWFKRSGSHPPEQPAAPAAEAASIGVLNEAEQDWLAGHLAALAEAGVDVDDLTALGSYYDERLGQWLATAPSGRADPNELINRIGLGLGEHIRRTPGSGCTPRTAHTDLAWVVAADQYGTEIALHRTSGDVLVYPTNMLAKRWSAQELGALPLLAEATIAAVNNIGTGDTG